MEYYSQFDATAKYILFRKSIFQDESKGIFKETKTEFVAGTHSLKDILKCILHAENLF